MTTRPKLSAALRLGRRALEALSGFELLQDWQWFEQAELWGLKFRLLLPSPPVEDSAPYLSQTSDWFVTADNLYPQGDIATWPAKIGGTTTTFPHQFLNGPGKDELPWRAGQICLTHPLSVLGRIGAEDEPQQAGTRLLWRIQQTQLWLQAAAQGTLAQKGEPWEIPDFTGARGKRYDFIFAEDFASLERWRSCEHRAGIAELSPWRTEPANFFVSRFLTPEGKEIYRPSWGIRFQDFSVQHIARAAWVRLDEVPVLAPWQVPTTWRELREICFLQNLDIDNLLALLPSLRDGQRHLALLGFPIPEIIGGAARQMHWQALNLPVLSHKKADGRLLRGFRNNPQSLALRDRALVLKPGIGLEWRGSQNWHQEQLATRGRMESDFRDQPILLIGAGALGAAVAELLMRAGVHDLTIIDGDVVEPGNLVRHTLSLSDVGMSKAYALAARLNTLSPQANARGIAAIFPPQSAESIAQVQRAQVIVDCTADDNLISAMAAFEWREPRSFASISLGWKAQRGWLFGAQGSLFPENEFSALISPWILREREEHAQDEVPREGVGCWHPIFPARADDIWLMAALAVKKLEKIFLSLPESPTLWTWEQSEVGEVRCFEQTGNEAMPKNCAVPRGDEERL